jgi:hypothetical protein
METIVQGGRESRQGVVRSNLLPMGQQLCRSLQLERPMESTNAKEAVMWKQWLTLRDYVWCETRSCALALPPIPCQITDLDETMRSVFDSALVGRAECFTLQTMACNAIARLQQQWQPKVTVRQETPIVPPSLVPVYTSIRDQLQPFSLR